MNPAPAHPPAPPAINYLKLTTSLMAVVLVAILFWHITNNWGDFKAGFNGTAMSKTPTTQTTSSP